jgi:hypothetical protein
MRVSLLAYSANSEAVEVDRFFSFEARFGNQPADDRRLTRQRIPVMMKNSTHEFERLLGKATLALWSNFPRNVQESLFETAVAGDAIVGKHLASYLHDHHRKTAPPVKPTQLA